MVILNKSRALPVFLLLLVYLLTGCGGAEERKAKYMERGKNYFNEENYDKAKVEFKNVIQIDPKAAEPYFYLGQIEEKRSEWLKAFRSYSKAVDLNPAFVDARLRLGKFYILAKEIDNASEQIDEVLSQDAGNLEALPLRASILKQQDKEEESVVILNQVVDEMLVCYPC